MTPAPFDFRKPPPGELVRQAATWLALACRRSAAMWPRVLSYPAELTPGPVEAVTAAVALSALPDDSVGVPAATADSADGLVLVSIRRPLLLALLAGLVGEVPTALPDDREPTEVEASLIGYMVRELFLEPLQKGWAGADPLLLGPGAPSAPRAALRVPSGDPFLFATFTVTTPFGQYPVYLLVPRTGRWERLAEADAGVKPPEPAAREHIEALVRAMPVDLSVVLGTADVSMHDLAGLRAGDLLILRQKVTQPLDGLVAGARKFRVRPGVIGTRAAVVIETREED